MNVIEHMLNLDRQDDANYARFDMTMCIIAFPIAAVCVLFIIALLEAFMYGLADDLSTIIVATFTKI